MDSDLNPLPQKATDRNVRTSPGKRRVDLEAPTTLKAPPSILEPLPRKNGSVLLIRLSLFYQSPQTSTPLLSHNCVVGISGCL